MGIAGAANLSNPQVDAYNVHVGTQTFAGLYQFTTNTLLVETAQAIKDLGSDVIKFYLGPDFSRQNHITLPGSINTLQKLVRDEPSCHQVLDMPFHHFVVWTYPFASYWPFDGYSSSEKTNEYQEIYDMTRYLVTNYNNSGKTFYLGHWEGDWYLLPDYNTSTNPNPIAIQGMIDWMNNRQKAVDDAKRDTPFTNVNVFCYTEANRVLDATSGNTNFNQRVINCVVPYVTNLDCLSWSSYDVQDKSSSILTNTLNYMQSMLPTNKAASFPGQRIWIGEYGWGGKPLATQESNSRAYIQRLLPWGPRFILFWEMYNNETNSNFSLIDSNNVKVASYYLHQRFLNQSRLRVAQFQETYGRLPVDSEFASLTTPLLALQLVAATNLTIANGGLSALGSNSATLTAQLTQGVYGDDQAAVWVCWGTVEGGTIQANWQQSRLLGVNTNFNPVTFSAPLTNLLSGANYFYRFFATNASGTAWAPASGQFVTGSLDPQAFGSRMKITFAGYTRSEPLSNFPVLVTFNTNTPGFSYRQFASPCGADLRFGDASGAVTLFHEIDEWNTNGLSSVWVQVPLLSSTNDSLWAYWGNPALTTPPVWATNGSAWSADFELVWHLKESGFPYADSTLKHPALSGNVPIMTPAGLVGRGASFDGAADFLNTGNVSLGDHFTLSAWVKVDSSANDIKTVWANKVGGSTSNGFGLFVNSWKTSDKKLTLETGNASSGASASTDTNIVSFAQWHHVAAAIDRNAGVARLYVDGLDRSLSTGARTDFPDQGNLALGYMTNNVYYFKGTMDEARIETQTRSSNWVWASCMTVASNSMLASYSVVTQQPPALSFSGGANGWVLNWPGSGVGFALYTATNLTPPVLWTPFTNSPVFSNAQWQVALPANNMSGRFYRLQLP